MAVRGFEYYGQTVASAVVPPFVAPTAPTATPARSTYMARVARSRLFIASSRVGVFAMTLWLLGQVLAVTWLGQVTGEQNMLLWLLVIACGNIVAGVLTLIAIQAGHGLFAKGG